MENENAAYFQAVQEEAMASSTKKLYNLKLKALIKFLMENYPEGLQSSVETGELEILLPVQDSILTEWMGKVCRNKRGEMLSYSVVEQARAAIIWLYKRNNIQISATCMEAVSLFSKGYKKRIARGRKEGVIKSKIGKDAMSVESFRVLMRHAWMSPSCFYAVFYLNIAWVLMSRSATVASLMYDHITWQNDALVVEVAIYCV